MKVVPMVDGGAEFVTPFKPLDFIRNLMKSGGYTTNEKIILVALAMHANRVGLTYPGVDLLAEETAMNRKTIMAALKQLEGKKAITKISGHGGGKRHNCYRIVYVSTPPDVREATADTSIALVPEPPAGDILAIIEAQQTRRRSGKTNETTPDITPTTSTIDLDDFLNESVHAKVMQTPANEVATEAPPMMAIKAEEKAAEEETVRTNGFVVPTMKPKERTEDEIFSHYMRYKNSTLGHDKIEIMLHNAHVPDHLLKRIMEALRS